MTGSVSILLLCMLPGALFVGFVIWRLGVERRCRRAEVVRLTHEKAAQELVDEERRAAWKAWVRRVEALYHTLEEQGPQDGAFQLSRQDSGLWRVAVPVLDFGWRYLNYPRSQAYRDPPEFEGDEARWRWEDLEHTFASEAEAEAFIAQAAQPAPPEAYYDAAGARLPNAVVAD